MCKPPHAVPLLWRKSLEQFDQRYEAEVAIFDPFQCLHAVCFRVCIRTCLYAWTPVLLLFFFFLGHTNTTHLMYASYTSKSLKENPHKAFHSSFPFHPNNLLRRDGFWFGCRICHGPQWLCLAPTPSILSFLLSQVAALWVCVCLFTVHTPCFILCLE